MAVSPAHIVSKPMEHLRDLVAATAAFQSWTGETTAADAKNHLYYVGLPKPSGKSQWDLSDLQAEWPFGVIGVQPEDFLSLQSVADGTELTFEESGNLLLILEDEVASANADDPADAFLAFANEVGAVLEDVMSLAGTDGHLWVSGIEGDEIHRADPDENEAGDFMRTVISVSWGFV